MVKAALWVICALGFGGAFTVSFFLPEHSHQMQLLILLWSGIALGYGAGALTFIEEHS